MALNLLPRNGSNHIRRSIDNLKHDVRFGLRTLRQNPGFALTAIVVLALGIGANSAVFSVVHTVLLQPLPYPAPDRLVQLMLGSSMGSGSVTSVSKFIVWREETTVFESMAAYDLGGAGVKLPGESEPLRALRVSADYFPLFGAPIAIGRSFSREEDLPRGPRVAVISDQLWRNHFHSDPNLGGKFITLDDGPYEVIGVMRPEFISDPSASIWLPLQPNPLLPDHAGRIRVAARLKPGVTIQQAQYQMRRCGQMFEQKFPGVLGPKEGFTAIPLAEIVIGEVRPALFILSGAVTFVLLIACANVASLLFVQAARRTREMATRAALGAGGSRIIVQLLTESLLLALAAGVLGAAIGFAGVRALLTLNPGNLPGMVEARIAALHTQTLLWTFFISVAAGFLFGLLPALASARVDLHDTLKEGGASGAGPYQTAALSYLTVAQVALALVLLAGSGLLIRTFLAMHHGDRGFDSRNVLTLEMPLAGTRFMNTADATALIRHAETRVSTVPGVLTVATASSLPLEPGIALPFNIPRRPLLGSPYHGSGQWRNVSRNYFDVLRIRVSYGRQFSDQDVLTSPPVVIINETLARKFWGSVVWTGAIGEKLLIGPGFGPEYADLPREIIGIVHDVRETGLNRDHEAILYVPTTQLPPRMAALSARMFPLTWIVRTSGEPQRLAGSIRHELNVVSNGLPLGRIRSMDQVVEASTARAEFSMTLLTIFAAIALFMAATGIYGLMAFTVAQRTREISVRMALGASPQRVGLMVMLDGLKLASAGVAIGVSAALAVTQWMNSVIFGIQTWDSAVYIVATILLSAISLIATYIPSRRAMLVDPMQVLRSS